MFLPGRRAFHVAAMSGDNDRFQGASVDKSTATMRGFHSPPERRGAKVRFNVAAAAFVRGPTHHRDLESKY